MIFDLRDPCEAFFYIKVMKRNVLGFLALVVAGTLLLGCAEPPERIHRKLEILLQNDLRFIVGEIQKETGKAYLLDEPYFVVRNIQFFEGDTARTYSAYAEVDFFYFKDIGIYQKRKYRYDTYRYWDRYYKKVMHAPVKVDSTKLEKP